MDARKSPSFRAEMEQGIQIVRQRNWDVKGLAGCVDQVGESLRLMTVAKTPRTEG